MNKAVGIGIGIVVVAIAAVFAFSYSAPESQPQGQIQQDSVAVKDEATVNVQVGVEEPGEKISIKAEDNLGIEETTP